MRGTIIKNEGVRGTTYTAMVRVPDTVTGEPKLKKKTFKKSGDADKWLIDTVNSVNNNSYIEPKKQTVKEYLTKWLENYGEHNLAPSTLESYKNIINNHLIPVLGAIPLQKLLPAHLQDYYSQALKGGRIDDKKKLGRALSPTTVLYHHRVIREALNHAMKSGILNRNVADMVKPPRKAKKEIQVLPEGDIGKLLDLFKGGYLYLPVYLALMTGMRAGEILAIRWADVDLKKGVININQSLRQRKVGQPEFQQPKTVGSRRTVEISPLVVKTLKKHFTEQQVDKFAFKDNYAKYNLVCCLQNGEPIHPGTLASRYYKITQAANIKINFHALRHSHATFLLKENISPKIVAERLGHSTTRLTMDTYSHVMPGMQKEAAKKLEKRLFGK
jgi:integrase